MPAATTTHIICVGALVGLIFTVQVFFSYVVDNVWVEMAQRELKEITDYVADTVANLYFLANSTNQPSVVLQKTLNLPDSIMSLTYKVEISSDARNVRAFFASKTWLSSSSWLPPGLTLDSSRNVRVEGSNRPAIVGCNRTSSKAYVWMAYG